ncbi:hypothetical protein ACVFI8_09295 [Agarivorans sp. MS3-6]|uniref:transporter substrate-binding domain-containing protein n=1 Tax=Agarivorans sp. TSD2052 TaxID=2937286 RepID=UPI0020102D34|nr:transporter substrate-binding domain-containing protein [Agarivorans sp. TSD2052]UPW18823.1 transporter substrate-binding domain-containing protein [Agarivorans sp. TSD2052]
MYRLLYLLIFFTALGATKPLNIPGSSAGNTLPIVLAQEIVKRSDVYSSLSFPYGEIGDISFAKTLADLNGGVVDLLWTATSADREAAQTAVYFPLYRGTLGMRLGIIEQANREIFSQVTSFSQMQQFIPCQGKLWADTAILEANGIKVAKSLGYGNIFAMLEADRCDYFPRGIFEPWSEIKREAKYNLTVDSYVMLRYKMPFFFFVKKDNQALAKHLNDILYQMFEDGSYQTLFLNDPDVKNALNLGKLEKRTVFDLDNPYLTDKVNAIPQKVWFDPLAGK